MICERQWQNTPGLRSKGEAAGFMLMQVVFEKVRCMKGLTHDKWRREYGLRRHCLSIEIRYNIYRLRIKESVVGVLFVWGEMSGFFYYLFLLPNCVS